MGDLGSHLINECTTAYLNSNMDIAHIQAYAQNLEDRKATVSCLRAWTGLT